MRSLLARLPLVPALASALAFTLACYGPAYRNGGLRCNEGLCPEGYYCAATTDHCWKNGTVPPLPDGMPDDFGHDAGPDGAGPNLDADLDHPAEPDVEAEPDVPEPLARLMSLVVDPGRLAPAFSPAVPRYDVDLPLFTTAVSVSAVAEDSTADLVFNRTFTRKGLLTTTLPVTPGQRDFTIDIKGPMSTLSTYKVTVNAGGAVTYVKPPNTHKGMAFGTTIALSGNVLVIGAPFDKSTAIGPQTGETPPTGVETGAAFVYVRSGSTWKREVTLKPSHLNPNLKFGTSVAISGDVIVVGAPGESGSGTGITPPFVEGAAQESGAAFVFVRSPQGDGWLEQAYLKASDTATGDEFGRSVAVAQGPAPALLTTVAVGAPGAGGTGSNPSPRTGAVYVFVRNAGVWTQQPSRPRPTNPKGSDEFGTSVSLASEWLVVGAPREDSGASGVNPGQTSSTTSNSGAAYIFTRNGTTWPQPVYVKAPVAVQDAAFGTNVAITSSGFVAVAAPMDRGSWRGIDPSTQGTGTIEASGAVFLYHANGTTWKLVHSIKSGMPRMGDRFGTGLALSNTTLVVGAPFDDLTEGGALDPTGALDDSGAIYVFRPGATGLWSQLVRLKAPNGEARDLLGAALATDGDTVAAGATGEASGAVNIDGSLSDNGALGSGAVYLY